MPATLFEPLRTDYSSLETQDEPLRARLRERAPILRSVLCGVALLATGYAIGAASQLQPAPTPSARRGVDWLVEGASHADGEAKGASTAHAAEEGKGEAEEGKAEGSEGAEEGKEEGTEAGTEKSEQTDPQVQLLAVSALVLFTLAMLRIFEVAVAYSHRNVPQPLHPVINSMLAELAGVGTIGLLLQLALAFLRTWAWTAPAMTYPMTLTSPSRPP